MKKRVSNIEVKKINRNRIFRYVNNRERTSKPEVAAALGISMPTVLQNVNELMEQGLVQEVGELESTGGRKAAAIAPVRNAYHALGIDITQNHLGFVLTDLSGTVLKHARVQKPFADDRGYYKDMGEAALEFLEREGGLGKGFLGVGISVPGIVDNTANQIVRSHALGIAGVDCSRFSEFLMLPSVFINDANAAAIAEIYHAETRFNAAYLFLGNSVGGAIIQERKGYLGDETANDRLYLGDNWRGGEFGHMTLVPGGNRCYCGKEGCLDAYCSAKNLSRHTDGKLERFFEEMEKGNKGFEKLWEEYLSHLAVEVNNLRMVFDCRVIIGGYVGSLIEPYLGRLQEKAAALNTFEADGSYIQACRYRVEASALGAALQQVEAFVSTV
ncbi:ROK family transcriptional regulator [Clostridiales bacterium F-3ap]|uniref:ROK family transcriptional regulator n=1 Tax=Anaerotalea alkaliphila TaxID=2662126 RepID=A0A7X5HX99_9FIRM|nr:ROK family transcriptional regulator [Anaerotalea alkaliphila]